MLLYHKSGPLFSRSQVLLSALAKVRAQLATAEAEGDFDTAAKLHSQLETIDGYSGERRVERLLQGLGFADDAASRPVGDFSGGWRIRL